MGKFIMFSAKMQSAFDNDASKYANFSSLLVDTGLDSVQVYSKEEANEKIREKFNALLGLDEKSTRKEIRRAIQHNQREVFDVIEDTVEDLLISGWQENEFFNEYVETKNLALGDENEFYVPDESVLTVSQVSGNHHALLRQRLGSGQTYKVKTSWYGIKY